MHTFEPNRIRKMVEAFKVCPLVETTENLTYLQICQVAVPDATLDEVEYALDFYTKEQFEFLFKVSDTIRARRELHLTSAPKIPPF